MSVVIESEWFDIVCTMSFINFKIMVSDSGSNMLCVSGLSLPLNFWKKFKLGRRPKPGRNYYWYSSLYVCVINGLSKFKLNLATVRLSYDWL